MRNILLMILLLFVCITFVPGVAQEESPTTERFISWSWEYSREREDQYPITQYSHWRSVGDPFGGGVRFLHFRTEEDADDYHLSGYVFFRPVVVRFADVFMSFGAFGGFTSFWNEFKTDVNVLNPSNAASRHGIPFAVGFSMLLTMPEQGILMTLEIGHVWRRIESQADNVVTPFPGLPPGEIQRLQKDTGVNVFYELCLVSEREFFSGITLNVLSTYISGPVELESKFVHPLLGVVPLNDNPERGSFVVGNAYLKIASLPLPHFISYLPAKPVFNIEPGFAVSHFTSDHGYGLSAGLRVSFFDMVRIFYFHNWDQHNDADDSDMVVIDVGFKIGRGSSGSGV